MPWFDGELLLLRAKKDKLYAKWLVHKDDPSIESKFCELKIFYNKLLRKKQIDYFKNKKSNDFKNSKKFWEFYRSHMKLKSDGSK